MGIYLNPDNENFKSFLSSGTYVDKTMMIEHLNHFIDTGNKYICVSRPRRFGKTFAGNMICAYYSKGCDSSELFEPLKISSSSGYEEKRNRYNVIKIDVNSEYQSVSKKEDLVKSITKEIKREMCEAFPMVEFEEEDSLARCILRVYAQTKETFIIIMDEYDVLVREKVDANLFGEYLSLLNGLFKSDTLRPAISLAYLTGILPIVRDKVQSKLNNFLEYTILDAGELSEFVGFTDDEVCELCEKNDMDVNECRSWYDGYTLQGYEIYNPESVIRAMQRKEYEGYWGKTSTYEAIAERIRMNFEGTREDVIRMLAGERVDVSVGRYMNTMDSFSTRGDVFTYLIHLGYLAYDRKEKTCRIPNREIRQEWLYAIEAEPEYKITNKIVQESKELLRKTQQLDEDAVAKALDVSHIHVTSNRSYNNEDALQSAIYLAYLYALNDYTCIREMTAGRGFADVVYIPIDASKTAMVIELKRNDAPESGIEQIKERKYFESLEHYKGDLLLIGINYDEKAKTHSCKIEKFEK